MRNINQIKYQHMYPCYPTNTNYFCSHLNMYRNRMNIEGIGNIKAMPNIAAISLGVITENEKLEVAQQQNAIKANEMIGALLSIEILKKDIKSYSYSIEQIYEYIDGKKTFRGYKVTNKFLVAVKNMGKIGMIIDTAVANGANTIYNVDFRVSDLSIYYRDALIKAVDNAIEKAQDIGTTLGTNVNKIPIKIIEEHYESYSPMQPVFRTPETDTPIIVGEVEISARIKAIFIY